MSFSTVCQYSFQNPSMSMMVWDRRSRSSPFPGSHVFFLTTFSMVTAALPSSENDEPSLPPTLGAGEVDGIVLTVPWQSTLFLQLLCWDEGRGIWGCCVTKAPRVANEQAPHLSLLPLSRKRQWGGEGFLALGTWSIKPT